MKATLDNNGAILITDHEGSPRFRHIFGGLGWADPQGADHFAANWVAVIGVQFDNTFTVLAEFSGHLSVIADRLVTFKDDLFMTTIFSNTAETALVKNLKAIDGLFSYGIIGRHHNVPVWKNPESTWSSFRARSHVAALVPTRPEIVATPQLGLDLINYLSQQNRFEIRHTCPRSSWLFRQRPPYTMVFRHPLYHSIVDSIYTYSPAFHVTSTATHPSTIPRLNKFGASK